LEQEKDPRGRENRATFVPGALQEGKYHETRHDTKAGHALRDGDYKSEYTFTFAFLEPYGIRLNVAYHAHHVIAKRILIKTGQKQLTSDREH